MMKNKMVGLYGHHTEGKDEALLSKLKDTR